MPQDDFKQHWCSGSDGSSCKHGHYHHGIACSPHTIKQAEEWLPACLFDDGLPRRASGLPIRIRSNPTR